MQWQTVTEVKAKDKTEPIGLHRPRRGYEVRARRGISITAGLNSLTPHISLRKLNTAATGSKNLSLGACGRLVSFRNNWKFR